VDDRLMRYGTFLSIVEDVSGLPRSQAERAMHAVLWVLGWRISAREAEDIAALLPAELRVTLTGAPEPAQAFGLDEFGRRVAKLEGVGESTAFEHARAVFVALSQAVAPGELRDMASQLPEDYEPLLSAADERRRAAEGRDDAIVRVAAMTGCDREQAWQAINAVLKMLAVRVSTVEIHDLIAELPAEPHPAIESGERVSRAAQGTPKVRS